MKIWWPGCLHGGQWGLGRGEQVCTRKQKVARIGSAPRASVPQPPCQAGDTLCPPFQPACILASSHLAAYPMARHWAMDNGDIGELSQLCYTHQTCGLGKVTHCLLGFSLYNVSLLAFIVQVNTPSIDPGTW